MVKDFTWEMLGEEYTILNVPCDSFDGEEFFDMDVAIKMDMVRELMASKRVCKVVDYKKIEFLDIDGFLGEGRE